MSDGEVVTKENPEVGAKKNPTSAWAMAAGMVARLLGVVLASAGVAQIGLLLAVAGFVVFKIGAIGCCIHLYKQKKYWMLTLMVLIALFV